MTTASKLVTYDDYRTLPDDGKRYQIIEGKLYMTPAPSTYHQRILGNLYIEMRNLADNSDLGQVLLAPTDIILSMTDVVQPDLIFVSKERSHIITPKNIVEAPGLVVEIINESTEAIDRNQKKELYEKHGVKEYWIVYPDKKQIEQFVLDNRALCLKTTFKESDILSSTILDGFSAQLAKVFAD